MSLVDELREQWERAALRDKHGDAVKALVELVKIDRKEPRWAHRLGEAYRRLGKNKEAEDAFAIAAEGYVIQGFVPRAVAMAKLVATLNPARTDLLERLTPKAVPIATAPTAAPAPARVPAPAPATVPAPPPTPIRSLPPPPPLAPPAPPPLPAPLARARDASADEVRFIDDPSASIDVVLEDISGIVLIEEDSEPDLSSLPIPREPSIDRLATMATFRLFAGLPREPLLALSGAAELVEFVPGAMVIVRNEPAFALYAIIGGTARVSVPGSPHIRLEEGDIFGEACLLDEGQRQADVRAETPLMTLRIEKAALADVTATHPEVEAVLFQLLARRLVMNLMHSSPLFALFEPRVRLELAQMFEVRRAEAGTVISERGRRTDALYVLLAGHVTATDASGSSLRVARGITFGQGSLVNGAPSDVTLEAVSEAVLLRLPATRFASLAALYPPALAHLAETASEPIPESRLHPEHIEEPEPRD